MSCFRGVSQIGAKQRFVLIEERIWLADNLEFSLLAVYTFLSARCSQNKFDPCPYWKTKRTARKNHLVLLLTFWKMSVHVQQYLISATFHLAECLLAQALFTRMQVCLRSSCSQEKIQFLYRLLRLTYRKFLPFRLVRGLLSFQFAFYFTESLFSFLLFSLAILPAINGMRGQMLYISTDSQKCLTFSLHY